MEPLPFMMENVLVELGRHVDNCVPHGDAWCSCKVKQYIGLMGMWVLDDDGVGEVRFATKWFPNVG